MALRRATFPAQFVPPGGGRYLHVFGCLTGGDDHWVNLQRVGIVFTVQKALPLLSDGASIILNASIVSVKGNPAFSIYSASKAAVRNLARSWSLDLKGRGIRVNVISPGVVPNDD